MHRLAGLLLVALGLAGGGSDPHTLSPARREFVRNLDARRGQINRLVACGNAGLRQAPLRVAVASEVAATIRDLLRRFRAIENRICILDAPPGENGLAAGQLAYTEQINDLFAASVKAADQKRHPELRVAGSALAGGRLEAGEARQAALRL